MVNEIDYACLAAFVYNDQRGGGSENESQTNRLVLPENWTSLSDLGFTTGGDLVENNVFSFTAGAYINDAGEIVISYKGTDFLVEFSGRLWETAADIATDVGLAIAKGIIGLPQLLSASTYYLEVVRWASENGHDPNKITFTGHSLGGGLASAMAVWFDRPATTFAGAPFELSAINAVFILTASNALLAQAALTGSQAVLEEINNLRDLLIPLEYQERQSAVTNYYVSGEFLEYGRTLPTVVGTDLPIDIGDQPIGRSLDLHSMNLHLALLLDDRLRQACIDIPELIPALLDKSLYFHDPNSSTRDFVTSLVADQLTGDLSRQDGLLGKFTSEILKLDVDGGQVVHPRVRAGLIAAAMEYCYFNNEESANTLFTVSGGGIHFKYSDIGAESYKSLTLLSNAVAATLLPEERLLAGGLRRQNAWHIQSGDGSLNWTASSSDPQNDAVIGGVQNDVIDAGLGNDVIIGGDGSDSLTGGRGTDILLGGLGYDKFYFSSGDGVDTIFDSDGLGAIFFNGTLVEVGERVAPNTWRSKDGQLMIERVINPEYDGAYELRIRNASGFGNSIIVRHWQQGNLGLQLESTPIQVGLTATIEGSAEGDEIRGGVAYETIIGLGSGDILSGGAGDDVLFAEEAVDIESAIVLNATGTGFETLGLLSMSGEAGDDVLSGGAGNDTLVGSGRGDVLAGGADDDLLVGGRGDDFLAGDLEYYIPATDDNDIEGFDWTFTETLDPENRLIYSFNMGSVSDGGSGSDILYAGGGDDVVFGGGGDDIAFGEDGDDRIYGGSGLDVVLGGIGNDVLFGDDGTPFLGDADFIDGGDGDDVVHGEGGDDFLLGGEDEDLVVGGAGDDMIFGGVGDDVIRGDFVLRDAALEVHHGNDILDGGDGNDQVIGDGGDDILFGGANDDVLIGDSTTQTDGIPELMARGNDYLDGGSGNDRLVGSPLNDTLIGGIGNDTLVGDASYVDEEIHGDDYLEGGDGHDQLFGGGKSDTLLGGLGNDLLRGDGNDPVATPDDDHSFDGDDYLDGGEGNDTLYGAGGADALIGGSGNDYLYGDALEVEAIYQGADYLVGGEGIDVLVGGGGNDKLYGGADSDQLLGDSGTGDSVSGDDYLDGGAGNDLLIGEGGSDTLIGGDGNDTLGGEATSTPAGLHGNDYLDGGHGNDFLIGEGGADTLLGGDGDDRLFGESSSTPAGVSGNDFLDGGAGKDTLVGGAGDDTLYGGSENDTLDGGLGADVLSGGSGSDILSGDEGDNTLDGGTGQDTLYGGSGADTYLFGRGYGFDQILDNGGLDRIELSVDIRPEDIKLIRSSTFATENTRADSGDSLVLVLNGNDQLLIGNAYAPGNSGAVEEIRFADGTVWDAAAIAAQLIDQSGTVNHVIASGATGTIQVDHSLDTIEATDDGVVQNVSSFVTYKLPDYVENLALTGKLATNATGNISDNLLMGNSAANVLDGFRGQDTLIGGAGDDTYHIDDFYYFDAFGNGRSSSSVIIEQMDEGYDTVVANDVSTVDLPDNVEQLVLRNIDPFGTNYYTYRGNNLDNVIDASGPWFDVSDFVYVDGGTGADTLMGSTGGQFYVVDNVGDVVIEIAASSNLTEGASGRDTVRSNVDYVLPSLIEDLILYGENEINGYGNFFNNRLSSTENEAANVLAGGAGDDTYEIGANDTIVEGEYGGIDTAEVSFDYTLTDNVENLTFTSGTGLTGHGNAADNVLNGASSFVGATTLYGGLGNDTYVLSEDDVAIEHADEGIDTIVAHSTSFIPFTYVLGEHIENGIAETTGATIQGNSLNNMLSGLSGASISLFGNAGDDILIGTNGNNTLGGGSGADVYRFSAGFGTDVIRDTNSGDAQDGATDVLEFDATVNRSEIRFSKSPDRHHLVVTIAGRSDQLTIFNFFQLGALQDRIEVLRFADGSTITADEIEQSFGIYGTNGDDTLVAPASGDELYGLGGSDTLIGGDGNDLLDGGTGADSMAGGLGDDVYRIDRTDDVVIELANGGVDTIESTFTYTLADTIENLTLLGTADINGTGNGGDNVLLGNSGNNTLDGGGGRDSLYGGAGDDSYYVDHLATVYENAAEGVDTVYAKDDFGGDNPFPSLELSANIENGVLLGSGSISLYGNASNNLLIGNAGSNQISGHEGADTMHGGAGDDFYYVDDAGDVVVEAANEGYDGVETGVSYALTDNVEALVLSSYFGGAITGTGNSLNNEIYGNELDNEIDGKAGADYMDGGAGNDTYVVDNAGDQIYEEAGAGTDTVRSSVNWTLGSSFENLILTGTATSGTGNSLANEITGNAANNTLSGGGGNDTLDGGAGNDSMSGGAGNDTYIVDSTSDIVTESSGQGTDTVRSSVTWTLGSNLENLALLGTSNINGTGNSSANTITGNSGNNTLNGGTGADALFGGGGDDIYVVDNIGDVITENANEGTDLVQSSITFTLGNHVENLTLTGSSAINGTGNALSNVLTGNSGNNRLTGGAGDDTLDGGSGNDTMIGGLGNDTYVVAQTSDVVTEAANEGIDLVRSSITHTLGNNVENLLLTGTSAISGTGNALDNFLTGNSANNTLTGGAGNDTLDGGGGTDTMRGGQGNDTYFVNVSADVTTENANEGIDLVNSTVTRTLAANIELLFLTGTAAVNGTGNTLSNLLRGNTANNTLAGGGGVDILEGGAGNDILSNTSGKTLLNGGAGTDTLTGTSSNDLLIGGTGNDTINTGSGADIIAFNKGDGQDTVAISTTKDNTLSIGGGAQYADLLFQKNGNDLILKVGASDQITFAGYYSSTSNRSVNRLQVVLEGSADYNAGSSDPLLNKKVETFNFDGLVSAFDAARAANPSLTTWALSGELAAQYLSGSDTAALGGDLAYRYGRFGNLSDLSFTPAAGILGASTFGTSAQTLQAVGALQDATQRLS